MFSTIVRWMSLTMRKPSVFAGGSIVIGLAVLSLKYFAFILTGSIAFYSDALESVVNVATAVVTTYVH